MTPKAFVFDCDGTLLDSMGMWWDSVPRLLRRYGIEATQRDFAETEHYPVSVCCRIFYEKYGVGGSPEGLVRAYNEMLAEEYRTGIGLCPGALELLEAAQEAGIPMAVASSTDAPLLEIGLAASGIREFFSGVFCTDDYNTSKNEPRIYDVARESLGAGISPAETWVFEDAPFGVATAKRAGYNALGVYDRHRADAEPELKRMADVYVRSLTEVTLDMLDLPAGR